MYLCRYWHRVVLSIAATLWWMCFWTYTNPQTHLFLSWIWIAVGWLPQITLTILALKYIGMSHCCKSHNLLQNFLLDCRCLMIYVISQFSLLANLHSQSTQNKPVSSRLKFSKHFTRQHIWACISHLDSILVVLIVVSTEVFCGVTQLFSVIFVVILLTCLYLWTSKFLTFHQLSSYYIIQCCITSALKQH